MCERLGPVRVRRSKYSLLLLLQRQFSDSTFAAAKTKGKINRVAAFKQSYALAVAIFTSFEVAKATKQKQNKLRGSFVATKLVPHLKTAKTKYSCCEVKINSHITCSAVAAANVRAFAWTNIY